MVPFPTGSLADGVARLMGPKPAEGLGQPVVVENKAGAVLDRHAGAYRIQPARAHHESRELKGPSTRASKLRGEQG